MQSGAQAVPISNKRLWAGRIISALPVFLLVFSGVMKLMRPAAVVQGFGHFGFPESLIVPIGVLELACTLVYVIPRTAVLGAILVTAFLGGATVTHVRLGEGFIMPVLAGMLVWIGLYLREARLHPLVPLRK